MSVGDIYVWKKHYLYNVNYSDLIYQDTEGLHRH
jgi:hypothetical protein